MWWEFPSGKIEPDETPEEALIREIKEELCASICVERFLCLVEYDYPNFHLSMRCYICRLCSDTIQLNEHDAARWIALKDSDNVKWLPADIWVVKEIKRIFTLNSI